MSILAHSSSHGSRSRARGCGARSLASDQAYRRSDHRGYVGHHRILLVPFARSLGGLYGLFVLPPACQAFSVLARPAASERHGTHFRRYHSHHSHPALADTSVSLCRVFGRVQQAHVWFMACSRMVHHHRFSRSSRSNFAMNETPNHALQRTATAVTARASTAAFPPTMHGPRQPPPSLSLGSLGDCPDPLGNLPEKRDFPSLR